ncbi:hydrolase [Lacticaseibacillus jixiensis]|uniref:hydrolase n=1 Tax=Lacticaseibacillus jixiensis TaxID=3231926 RepID=UPI0036F409C9
MFAINTASKTVEAIDSTTSTQHAQKADNGQASAHATAKYIVSTNHMLHPVQKIEIKVGVNKIAEERERIAAQKAAQAKAAAARAAAQRAAQAKAAAALRAKQAAAQKAAQQQAAQQQASQQAQQQTTTTTAAPVATTTSNHGTFKLSFYDPAVMGSNMGYSGVAANLSVFPRGTRLKITLSDGTVWYRTVNDTGSFAQSNSRQLDVAMPSSQIPSAGVLYATVEVVG